MKIRWAIFFGFMALIIYGRSLPYAFVYDDHWRVETNQAVAHLSNIGRFFTDRTSQSSNPALHRDSYRPLVTLSFAIDYALWGLRPAGYRLINIFLHGANAWLLAWIGMSLLGLSLPASVGGALIFLAHPIQIESVVWIVERTNVLCEFFTLLALVFWIKFLRSSRPKWAGLVHATVICALLTREVAVVIPALLFLARFVFCQRKAVVRPNSDWIHAVILCVEVLLFLGIRSMVIGQMKIADYWGGGFFTNLANVFAVWPQYIRAILWPLPLRITYAYLPVAESWLNRQAITGFCLFLAVLVLAIAWRKREPVISFCLFSFLLFWLPGSNIVPLTTLFAERLVYPILAWAGLMAAVLFDKIDSKRKTGFATGLIVLLATTTVFHLPSWKNDLALWENATVTAPGSWFAWACLGQQQHRLNRLDEARASYRHALGFQVPVDSAALLFFHLARVDRATGREKEASENARRAIFLKPALQPIWQNVNDRDVITSSTE